MWSQSLRHVFRRQPRAAARSSRCSRLLSSHHPHRLCWHRLKSSSAIQEPLEVSSQRDIAHIIPHISYSSLRNFVECPKRFYFSHIARLPAVVNANMIYGSAVHAALDEMFSSEGEDECEVVLLKQVLNRYHSVWDRSDFGLSSTKSFPHGTKHVRDLGEETVKNFFSRYRGSGLSGSRDASDREAADSLLQLNSSSWRIQPEKSFEVSIEPRSASGGGGSSSTGSRSRSSRSNNKNNRSGKCGGDSSAPSSFKIRGIFDLLCEPRRPLAQSTTTEAIQDKVRARDVLAKRTGLAKAANKPVAQSPPDDTRVPTIVEFKTTLRSDPLRPRNWHRAHELQLKIYALAYTKLGENLQDAGDGQEEEEEGGGGGGAQGQEERHERPLSASSQVQVVLKSVESGEEYVALYGPEELSAVEEELSQIHSQMQRSAFEARPSFRACSFCSYSHICPSADDYSARYEGRVGAEDSLKDYWN